MLGNNGSEFKFYYSNDFVVYYACDKMQKINNTLTEEQARRIYLPGYKDYNPKMGSTVNEINSNLHKLF